MTVQAVSAFVREAVAERVEQVKVARATPGVAGNRPVASRLDLSSLELILLTLAVVSVVAAFVAAPLGPLFLLPPLLAAFRFGPGVGAATGIAATGLWVLARIVDPNQEVPPELSVGVRLAVFTGTAYLVGRLAVQRWDLRTSVERQRDELGELRVLRDVLTPAELPELSRLELATAFVPAQHGVGGDFYLVAEGPAAGSSVIVVGDVAGKGPEAALRASYVRAAIATFVPFTDDPARLLQMANYSLIEKVGISTEFVTAACVVVHESGTLEWALAGHPPPLWLDRAEPLAGARPGLPLGIDINLRCGAGSATVEPGGGLVLFSDGLLEARVRRGSMLGGARVRALVAGLDGASPERIVAELRGAAEAFSDGSLADDLCILALRVVGAPIQVGPGDPGV